MRAIATGLFVCLLAPLSGISQSLPPTSGQEWKSIDDYSIESLIYARANGSVILSGICQHNGDGKAVFAGYIHKAPANPPVGLDGALNFLTSVEPQITWSIQKNGMVRIVDSRVFGSILRIKIGRVEVKDALDIEGAVDQVLSLPEVVSFLSQSHIQLMRNYSTNRIFGAVRQSKPATPLSTPKHSLILEDVTLEVALDRIAQDFAGAWEYCECPGRITIDSYHTGIPKFWSQAGGADPHK
jgi:hypothetical protein